MHFELSIFIMKIFQSLIISIFLLSVCAECIYDFIFVGNHSSTCNKIWEIVFARGILSAITCIACIIHLLLINKYDKKHYYDIYIWYYLIITIYMISAFIIMDMAESCDDQIIKRNFTVENHGFIVILTLSYVSIIVFVGCTTIIYSISCMLYHNFKIYYAKFKRWNSGYSSPKNAI